MTHTDNLEIYETMQDLQQLVEGGLCMGISWRTLKEVLQESFDCEKVLISRICHLLDGEVVIVARQPSMGGGQSFIGLMS